MGILDAVKKGFGDTTKLMNVVLIFFVFNVIVGLVSLPMTNPENVGNPQVVAASVITSIIFFLAFIFLQGGALGMVKDQLKTGSASLGQFANYGKKFYLRILGLLLIYILIAIGVILILSLISAGLLLLGDNVFIRSIVAVIVTVAAVGVITLLIYPIYSIVSEDVGPVTALKRGVSAAKGNFLRTLGLFMVLLLVMLVISLIIGFFVGLVTIPLGENASRIILAIVNAAVQSYVPIVMMVAFMSMYLAVAGGAPAKPAGTSSFGPSA
jgi:hypothetical protein